MTTRVVPLFPLPIILFPGASQLLHIFEHRYRNLLADCLAGDREFGLSYLPTSGPHGRNTPEPGDLGCIAEVQSHQPLGDGRSHILTTGVIRFSLAAIIPSDAAYAVGQIDTFEDTDQHAATHRDMAQRLSDAFKRLSNLMSQIGDAQPPVLSLPTDPTALSFVIAGSIPLPISEKLALLEMTSTGHRLKRLLQAITSLTTPLEQQLKTHKIGKRNGNAGQPPRPHDLL